MKFSALALILTKPHVVEFVSDPHRVILEMLKISASEETENTFTHDRRNSLPCTLKQNINETARIKEIRTKLIVEQLRYLKQ